MKKARNLWPKISFTYWLQYTRHKKAPKALSQRLMGRPTKQKERLTKSYSSILKGDNKPTNFKKVCWFVLFPFFVSFWCPHPYTWCTFMNGSPPKCHFLSHTCLLIFLFSKNPYLTRSTSTLGISFYETNYLATRWTTLQYCFSRKAHDYLYRNRTV